jgi:chromosome segregation ATPase
MNIYLSEVAVQRQANEKKVKAEHDTKFRTLEKERDDYCLRQKTLEREIGSILDGVDEEGERKDGVANGSLTLQERLKEFTERHDEARKKVEVVGGDLKYKEDAVRHLHELLSAKDEQMSDLNAKVSEKEIVQRKTAGQAKQFSALCDRTQEELDATREEVERLRRLTENQHAQLVEVNRKMHVQECRMGNIKNLVSSLSYNVQTWAVDDEWDQKQSTVFEGMEIAGKEDRKKKHVQKRTEAFFLTESDSFDKPRVESELSFAETTDTAKSTRDHLDEDDDFSSAISASPARSHAYGTRTRTAPSSTRSHAYGTARSHAYGTASSSARSHMSC